MITQVFFSKQMNRLGETFPAVKNLGRLSRYHKAVQFLPDHALEEIIDGFLDRAKHAPTPADFQEAASAWRRANVEATPQTITVQRIQCLDCYETGWIHCRLNQHEPETLAYCHCEFGARNEGQRSNFIPRWQQDTFAAVYGFIKLPFPMQKFTPKSDEEKARALAGLGTGGVNWRNQLVANAENYWERKANKNSDTPQVKAKLQNEKGEG